MSQNIDGFYKRIQVWGASLCVFLQKKIQKASTVLKMHFLLLAKNENSKFIYIFVKNSRVVLNCADLCSCKSLRKQSSNACRILHITH